ncbi:hypothetical protein ABIF68_004090 [Bradyrhizobium japonicum]|uniref:hypothetical protein n=2 Tax=Bradyrhizobium TaxID=374 RepID=UPI001E63E84C|nr:hypothetical protein [Bradyrhizobium japonicum]
MNQRSLLPFVLHPRWGPPMATMRTNSRQQLDLISELDPTYLESLIREDFERCHPGETLEDLQRRASFSKEDRGLLRDWMAVAAVRAAAACKAKALPPHPTISSGTKSIPALDLTLPPDENGHLMECSDLT